jgi:threonine/homoserine efflux transporter RhtA
MSRPAQAARGARLPGLPAPLATIAGALSVQLGGAALVGAAALGQGLGVRDVVAIACVVAASTGALASAARVPAAQ